MEMFASELEELRKSQSLDGMLKIVAALVEDGEVTVVPDPEDEAEDFEPEPEDEA